MRERGAHSRLDAERFKDRVARRIVYSPRLMKAKNRSLHARPARTIVHSRELKFARLPLLFAREGTRRERDERRRRATDLTFRAYVTRGDDARCLSSVARYARTLV